MAEYQALWSFLRGGGFDCTETKSSRLSEEEEVMITPMGQTVAELTGQASHTVQAPHAACAARSCRAPHCNHEDELHRRGR